MDRKSTLLISLVFMGAAAPLFLMRERQDCYPTKVDCEKDWSGQCQEHQSPAAASNCRFLGRSYSGFHSGGYYGGTGGPNKSGTITRSGFGSIGRSFTGGS